MNKIAEIFTSLDYGPAPESPDVALAWLAAHDNTFGHFIDGKWTKPGKTFATDNPATNTPLAQITDGTADDVNAAVKAARAAFPKWSALSGYQRGKHLYAIARLIQKHSRLFAVLETMDNRSARAAMSISRSSPAISTTTPAGPSTSSASSPTTCPMASAARSSRGTSRC